MNDTRAIRHEASAEQFLLAEWMKWNEEKPYKNVVDSYIKMNK
jgi:hypothetical protein